MIATELKLVGIGISSAALIGVAIWVPEHFKEVGRQEVKSQYAEASRQAIIKRNAEIEALKVQHLEVNKKVMDDYEKQLSDQKISYDKRIATLRNAGGLRLPESACTGLAATPESNSAAKDNDSSGYRLPERIENGLFDLARKADETVIQLRSCQKWIKENGFYH